MSDLATLTANGWLCTEIASRFALLDGNGRIPVAEVPPNGEDAMSTVIVVPTTGQTVTVAGTTRTIVLKPAGLLAALTVKFPASPVEAQPLEISATQAITLLTLDGNGKSIVGGAATLALGGFLKFRYASADGAWYRIG